ncbi:MAG: hypothetical protein AB8F95_03460 [Bacteroidia bacterium]
MQPIVICLLLALALPFATFAQKTNQAIYRDLLSQVAAKIPEGVHEITGDTLIGFPTQIRLTPKQSALKIDFPDLSYQKISKDSVLRIMRLSYTLQDSNRSQSASVMASDTLHIDTLKSLRKEAIKSLRGGAITGSGRFLRAILLVSGSIGAVFALFRFRTR